MTSDRFIIALSILLAFALVSLIMSVMMIVGAV